MNVGNAGSFLYVWCLYLVFFLIHYVFFFFFQAEDGIRDIGVTGVQTCALPIFVISNGLAWSPDGALMFHSDSAAPWFDRHDFDPATGAMSGRARIAAEGAPDGAATDAEGAYWSCGFGTGALNRYAADGRLDRKSTRLNSSHANISYA